VHQARFSPCGVVLVDDTFSYHSVEFTEGSFKEFFLVFSVGFNGKASFLDESSKPRAVGVVSGAPFQRLSVTFCSLSSFSH